MTIAPSGPVIPAALMRRRVCDFCAVEREVMRSSVDFPAGPVRYTLGPIGDTGVVREVDEPAQTWHACCLCSHDVMVGDTRALALRWLAGGFAEDRHELGLVPVEALAGMFRAILDALAGP